VGRVTKAPRSIPVARSAQRQRGPHGKVIGPTAVESKNPVAPLLGQGLLQGCYSAWPPGLVRPDSLNRLDHCVPLGR